MQSVISKILSAVSILLLFAGSIASASEMDGVFPDDKLQPFGSSIFNATASTNASSITDPNRLIGYGDRMLLRMWGALEYEKIIMVDAEGRIFIPQVGPVAVAQKNLSEAQEAIKSAVSQVYRNNVSVHATLADVNPISVYVTGDVTHPGRYEGTQSDTVLEYIIKSGGIRPNSGSYRKVEIRRKARLEAEYDFYDFIMRGDMLAFDFQHGDTIVVKPIGFTVSVLNGAQNRNSFEFTSNDVIGLDLINQARPDVGTSHVLISRQNGEEDNDVYLTIEDFEGYDLHNGDSIIFKRDTNSNTISVSIRGEVEGQKTFALKKGASLKQLLSFIPVDSQSANISAIHIERPSVAMEQQKAFQQSLMRLQQSALTNRSATGSQAQIKAAEADMIQAFTMSSKDATFDGAVAVSRKGKVSDIVLQDGDTIVIPRKSDVILVNGEVMMTNAILFEPGLRVKDYIMMAGGLTRNSDPDNFVVNHANGSSTIATADTRIIDGDQILAMPKIDNKNLALAKEVVGIMYQLAMGARAATSF